MGVRPSVVFRNRTVRERPATAARRARVAAHRGRMRRDVYHQARPSRAAETRGSGGAEARNVSEASSF